MLTFIAKTSPLLRHCFVNHTGFSPGSHPAHCPEESQRSIYGWQGFRGWFLNCLKAPGTRQGQDLVLRKDSVLKQCNWTVTGFKLLKSPTWQGTFSTEQFNPEPKRDWSQNSLSISISVSGCTQNTNIFQEVKNKIQGYNLYGLKTWDSLAIKNLHSNEHITPQQKAQASKQQLFQTRHTQTWSSYDCHRNIHIFWLGDVHSWRLLFKSPH